MKTDKEIAREILDKEFQVTTISWSNIGWFQEECNNGNKISGVTARSRLRKALNELAKEKYCENFI